MAEAAGASDAAWLSSIVDGIPAALFVIGPDGLVVLSNAASQQTFGRAREQIERRPFDGLLSADDRAPFLDDLRRCLAEPGVERVRELLATTGEGRPFPVELVMKGLRAASVVVVARDLTERRRQETAREEAMREARDARDWLEALLGFAPAIIVAISESGTIEFINRTLPQHTKKDVIGTSWLSYFAEERQALMKAELETTFRTHATRTFETVTPGPDGTEVWFESQIAPIRVEEKIVGAVVVSQEITERKRTQAELLASRHMALLGTLAAGVAHEINTPIQFVGDSLEFLRDSTGDLLALLDRLQELRRVVLAGTPPSEAIEEARIVEEEADLPYLRENIPSAFERCLDGLQRVRTIVRSLKDFAHPSEETMSPSDINRAVETTLTIATNEYKYVAEVRMDLGELPPVTCYLGEISQAILNIVVNAAHAIAAVVAGTEKKGLITVRTRREGETVVIAISDTGTGIPESIRSRVFDPFFTTKEVGKGTGQGLAIAFSAVTNRHGGELTFESQVGRGTTFFIRLPIHPPEKRRDSRSMAVVP
jgi:PAS domain S-box-containing protein